MRKDLQQFAEHHRLTPLLLRALRSEGRDIPPETLRVFQDSIRRTAQQNLALFMHSSRICNLLRTNGIEALALKGPTLSWQLYGDLHYRVCGDVDVLVKDAAFGAAAQLLSANGYHADIALDDKSLRAQRARTHDLAFAHEDGTLVELHVDIAQPHYSYRTDLERWFARAETLVIHDARIAVPCAEHALLLAIVHGTKHAWERLDLVADVAGLARLPLDWEEVRAVVHAAGAQRAAATAFWLAREFAGLAITEFEAFESGLGARVRDRLLASVTPTYWQARRFDVAVRERTVDRARYLLGMGLRLSDKFSFT